MTLATPSAQRAPAFYIPSLDGVRAVSFFVVFLHHGRFCKGLVPGGFGVTTFFVLSGYLITTLLRIEHQERGRFSLKNFYLRRAARILPPMYLSLLLAFVLLQLRLIPGQLSTLSLACQLLHVTNYVDLYTPLPLLPGTGGLWSLAVEEHFYLLFPVFYLLLIRYAGSARRQAGVIVAVCAAVLLWRITLVYGWHVAVFRASHTLDTRADSLLLGSALAIAANPVLDEHRLSDGTLSVLAIGSVAGLLATIAVPDTDFRETFRYTLESLLLLPLFTAVIRLHARWWVRPLNWGWVRYVGVLSYGLYVFHQICLVFIDAHVPVPPTRLGDLAHDCIALLLSVAVAWLVHIVVEKPFAELRKRLTYRDDSDGSESRERGARDRARS